LNLRSARTALSRLKGVLRGPTPPLVPFAERAGFTRGGGASNWYDPILLNPATVGGLATDKATLERVAALLAKLEPDDYQQFVTSYYREGLTRYGGAWVYADILTVLSAASQLLRPERYLEIGVRRGRSLATVLEACPECHVVGFDLWMQDYAGMPNPGPEFVREEIAKLGMTGTLELVSGSSHETVARYFREHPDQFFDLITVDGDHTEQGARDDLVTVIPRLKRGGILVFDDIAHPHHPELTAVWNDVVVNKAMFRTWGYRDLGFGVGLAIRS
jgi:predicted O-methyltransferase YrrM